MLTNAVAPDMLGGLERYVRELSAALVLNGVSVTVLTKRTQHGQPEIEEGEDGVTIVRHAVPAKTSPLFALKYPVAVAGAVNAQLRRHKTAIIHGHYAITTLPLSLRRSPYMYTFHAPVNKEVLAERAGTYRLPRPVRKSAVRAVRTAERHVLRRAEKAVVLSEFMRDELAELSPTMAASAQLIAGGIDTTWFNRGPSQREVWARDGAPLLFTARRLTHRTGVEQLVEAMPPILSRFPDAKLAIAGDGALRSAVEGTIARLGLASHVHLLGRISDAELRNWYRSADLSITPTQELEGFGLSTAESLACGTLALVTPVGANPELVSDIHPLLLADDHTPQALAAAVCRLLEASPSVLRAAEDAGHAKARASWSWDCVARHYIQIYEPAMASRRDR